MTGTDPFPTFPGHDGGEWSPVSVRVVASWPVGTFAENLVVDDNGKVFVSLHSHRRIGRYDPTRELLGTFCEFPAPVAGLALDAAGELWATGVCESLMAYCATWGTFGAWRHAHGTRARPGGGWRLSE